MLTIKNVEVHGLERSMAACRNPMLVGEIDTLRKEGNSDRPYEDIDLEIKRAKALGKAAGGSGHDNFLKGIIVQFDVKYPQYWTPEAQRYHWLDIVSSQSKMHRLTTAGSSEEFASYFNKYVDYELILKVKYYVDQYNAQAELDQANSLLVKENPDKQYYWFMKALSNLPMGYEMWETLSTNYLQLKNIYNQRKGHKLKEDWGAFIKMCDKLPLFLQLIGKE